MGCVQVDMESARSKELQFFKANPRYADLKNVGMNFLSGKLSNHLIGAIRRQLPAIQNQINTGEPQVQGSIPTIKRLCLLQSPMHHFHMMLLLAAGNELCLPLISSTMLISAVSFVPFLQGSSSCAGSTCSACN